MNCIVPTTGYGQYFASGKVQSAHRVAYQLFKGPIPTGLEIDHLCRVRACVNPEHLEAVTRKVNHNRGLRANGSPEIHAIAAALKARTHCKAGHPYTEENTQIINRPAGKGRGASVERKCRICGARRMRNYRAKKSDEQLIG